MHHLMRWFCRWSSSLALILLSQSALAGSALRVSGNHEGNCYNPVLASDGSRVGYEVNYFEKRVIDLYVYDLAAKSEAQITPTRMGGGTSTLASFNVQKKQVTYELSWHPSRARSYVFSSSGDDENYNLYFSTGGVIAEHPAADGMPVWSRDAKWLVFASARTGEGDLYLVDIEKVEEKPRRLTTFEDSTEWYPSFSPSGDMLLFVRHYSKGGDNLYLMTDFKNPSGSLVQLTDWPSIQTRPSWSPDEKQIAFYSNRAAKERYDLYVMDAVAGATPRLLLEGVLPGERRGPVWSPDGEKLLIVREDPERFNPIRMVHVADPTRIKIIATGTQNNGDLHLAAPVGAKPLLTFTAQGRIGDDKKTFKRVYVYTLEEDDLKF